MRSKFFSVGKNFKVAEEELTKNAELLKEKLKLEYKKLYEFVSKVARTSRAKQKQLLSYGLSLSRYCLLTIYGRHELMSIIDKEEADFIVNISKFLNEKNALTYAALFEDAILHIDRNGNASVIFMDLSVKAGMLLNPVISESTR